jgi:serine/threonine protein kinase
MCNEEGRRAILLEYASLGNLLDYLSGFENGAAPIEIQFKILYDLSNAVYWVERRKMLHADLKPENIGIDGTRENPSVKLIGASNHT